jgi:hypothetical protein
MTFEDSAEDESDGDESEVEDNDALKIQYIGLN